jgi:methionyl-tRNA formyltransferase
VRLAFLGTPEIAVPPLRALVAGGHDVALAVTRVDKRRGRGNALQPSPVKAAAEELGIPVSTEVDAVLALDPPAELGVVVAFGRIIKPHVLAALPMVNVHFSLLPRWRGAAPVERAILAGDERTGVCLMAVEEGLDTGGVYCRSELDIGPDETAAALRERLVAAATPMLLDALRNGLGPPEPQDGEPTYADKIDPAELHIDWSQPAIAVHRLVRIGDAWTTFHGRRLKVWRTRLGADPAEGIVVDAGDGPLAVIEVQPEGKGRMPARDWARGARWSAADPLGS